MSAPLRDAPPSSLRTSDGPTQSPTAPERRRGDPSKTVIVVDADGELVEYVNPAVARRATKEPGVEVISTNPFTLQLARGMTRCPVHFGKSLENASMRAFNFTEFFRQEQDIFVRCLKPGQVSISFKLGMSEYNIDPIPYTGDPVQLTDRVPFEAIKNSSDLRRLVLAQPPVLELMTFDQVQDFYKKRARSLGMTVDAYQEQSRKMAAQMSPRGQTSMLSQRLGKTAAPEETRVAVPQGPQVAELIQPKVMSLCQRSSESYPEERRLSAAELLMELKALGNTLTEDDCEYIRSRPKMFKSVKTFIDAYLAQRAAATEAPDTAGDVDDATNTEE